MRIYFKKNRQSFTLIETLIAVSIFMVATVVSWMTVVTLTRTKSKIDPVRSTQDSGQRAMDMIVDGAKSSSAISINNYLSTGAGNASLRIPLDATTFRYFKLRKWVNDHYADFASTDNYGDGTQCPATVERCGVVMIDNNGSEIRNLALTSPDVNVTSIYFAGVPTTSTSQKAYVSITLQLQSAWPSAVGTNLPLTLHTTVINKL